MKKTGTVPSFSNKELHKEHQKTLIPLPPATAPVHVPSHGWSTHSLAVTLGGPVVPFVVRLRLFCEEHLVEAVRMKRTANITCVKLRNTFSSPLSPYSF